jgi:hypothetical protein
MSHHSTSNIFIDFSDLQQDEATSAESGESSLLGGHVQNGSCQCRRLANRRLLEGDFCLDVHFGDRLVVGLSV